MHRRRAHGSTSTGLLLLAAALGLSLFSLAFGSFWATLLAMGRFPESTVSALHTFWMPLSGIIVDAATVLLGFMGFAFVWRGRWEIGAEYASRVGLAMFSVIIAGVAYAMYALTGVLVAYFSGFAALVPWHGAFALVGGLFLGFGLYWILANLPVAGARPLAAVAFALGVAGLAILALTPLDVRRFRIAGLEGAGIGLALASLVLWLVLCLWGEGSLRNVRAVSPSTASTQGS